MEKATPNINPKYIDMVARFKAIPNDRKHSIQRLKMILFKFEPWYKDHRDKLTKDEREYLQTNIYRVDKEDEVEESACEEKDPWDE